MANLTRTMPNVEIEGANYSQTISYAFNGNSQFLITVKAENGDEQVYTINLVESKDNVTALNNIVVEGYIVDFDATTLNYNIEMAAEAVAPYVYFEKTSEGQSVNVVVEKGGAKLEVTAQDGETKAIYTLNFVRPNVTSVAQFVNITLNAYQLDGFATDKYDYIHNAQVDPIESLYYEKVLASDVVTHLITPDSVILKLASFDGLVVNNYRIIYEREAPIWHGSANYFLDFKLERNGKLIDLEIDGKQHTYEDRAESDKVRDAFLESNGYIVYRVPWNEVSSEQGKVLMQQKINDFIEFHNSL
jgi:hypothetical protein